jgi:hypothetical protein
MAAQDIIAKRDNFIVGMKFLVPEGSSVLLACKFCERQMLAAAELQQGFFQLYLKTQEEIYTPLKVLHIVTDRIDE